jgi:hypothetical protein
MGRRNMPSFEPALGGAATVFDGRHDLQLAEGSSDRTRAAIARCFDSQITVCGYYPAAPSEDGVIARNGAASQMSGSSPILRSYYW